MNHPPTDQRATPFPHDPGPLPLQRLPQDLWGELQQQHRGAVGELQGRGGDAQDHHGDSGVGQAHDEQLLRRLRDHPVAPRRRLRRRRRHAHHQGRRPRRPRRHQQRQARRRAVRPGARQVGRRPRWRRPGRCHAAFVGGGGTNQRRELRIDQGIKSQDCVRRSALRDSLLIYIHRHPWTFWETERYRVEKRPVSSAKVAVDEELTSVATELSSRYFSREIARNRSQPLPILMRL